jgi:hypothetical protein
MRVAEGGALDTVSCKVSVNPVPVAALAGRSVHSLSDGERIQCARDFFLTGNLSAIARERGIAYNDLLDMARQPWWTAEVQGLEREANAQLKVRLTKMLGKTLDELEDRLSHGDTKLDQYGQARRVPVPARDLATISNVIFDKKRQIEDSGSGFGTSETKRLLDLAAALRAKEINAEIYDAEVIGGTSTKDVAGDLKRSG